MDTFTFTSNNQTYTLEASKCLELLNAIEKPLQFITLPLLFEWMENSSKTDFAKEYFDEPCDNCSNNPGATSWSFHFLEFHFFVFTKNKQFSGCSLEETYELSSFNKLQRLGIADSAYLVSIIFCPNCASYTVEIELADY